MLNREEVETPADDVQDDETPPEERKGLLSPSVTLSQLEEAALWLTDAGGLAGMSWQTPLADAEREIESYLAESFATG